MPKRVSRGPQFCCCSSRGARWGWLLTLRPCGSMARPAIPAQLLLAFFPLRLQISFGEAPLRARWCLGFPPAGVFCLCWYSAGTLCRQMPVYSPTCPERDRQVARCKIPVAASVSFGYFKDRCCNLNVTQISGLGRPTRGKPAVLGAPRPPRDLCGHPELHPWVQQRGGGHKA